MAAGSMLGAGAGGRGTQAVCSGKGTIGLGMSGIAGAWMPCCGGAWCLRGSWRKQGMHV